MDNTIISPELKEEESLNKGFLGIAIKILDIRSQIRLGIALCLMFLLGLVVAPPSIIILGAGIFVMLYLVLNNEFASLLLFISINALLAIKPSTEGSNIYELVVGLLILAVALVYLMKRVLRSRSKVVDDSTQIFFILYFLWGSGIGILGFFLWGNKPELWMRETLIPLPFLMIPLLMLPNLHLHSKKEKVLLWSVAILWLVITFANINHLRNSIAEAYFLFQTGRASADVSISSLMFFVFLSLSFHFLRGKSRGLVLLGALISVGGILICFFRTIWLTDLCMIPVLFIFADNGERKRGLKFLIQLILILTLFAVIFYFTVPLFALLLKNYGARLTSVAHTGTDISLLNRYIEWENILKTIKISPLIGYGFGGEYWGYNWLGGFTRWEAYTHNGYLYILLKTGIIGLILISITYVKIIFMGISLARNPSLTGYPRALVRAAIIFLISLLFVCLTLNTLAQRDAMLWGGVVWGYFLLCEKYLAQNSEIST